MDSVYRLCSDCGSKTAEFFCSCSDPETFLCEEHLSTHTAQVSEGEHQSWRITLLQCYKSPAFLHRLEAFPRVRDEAFSSIEQVNTAITELTNKVEEIKAALTVLCSEKVKELLDMKASLIKHISLALEEVERTLTEEEPLLNTLYGNFLRQYIEKTGPLEIFSFTIEICTPLLSVHSQLSPQYYPSTTLAAVWRDGAYLYNVQKEHLTRHVLSKNFGDGGSYVELDRRRLLCVGARPASSAVYLLELPSFQLSALPSLSTPRVNSGLAKVKDRIYAFGGLSDGEEVLSSCEKTEKARAGLSLGA